MDPFLAEDAIQRFSRSLVLSHPNPVISLIRKGRSNDNAGEGYQYSRTLQQKSRLGSNNLSHTLEQSVQVLVRSM